MKKLVFALVGLLLVGVFSAWRFLHGSDRTRDVLPADATAVLVLRPTVLTMEMGMTVSEIKKLSSLSSVRWSRAVNPMKPVYAFLAPSGLTCIAVSVRNADRLEQLLSARGLKCEESGGLRWACDRDRTIGCFDDDRMLMCLPAHEGRQDTVRREMAKLMSQGRHAVRVLERAERQKGTMGFSASFDLLPPPYARMLPDEASPADVFLDASLHIRGQKAQLTLGVSDASYYLPLAPIKGDLPCAVEPSGPLLRLCAGIKGEQLLHFMCSVPRCRIALMGLSLFMDASQMIQALDGDMTLLVSTTDTRHYDFLLTVPIASPLPISIKGEETDRLLPDFSHPQASSSSPFGGGMEGVSWGLRDGLLYLTSNTDFPDKMPDPAKPFPQGKEDPPHSSLEERKEGSPGEAVYLYATVNARQFPSAYLDRIPLPLPPDVMHGIADAIEGITLSASSPKGMELNIEASKTIKQIFMDTWKQLCSQ